MNTEAVTPATVVPIVKKRALDLDFLALSRSRMCSVSEVEISAINSSRLLYAVSTSSLSSAYSTFRQCTSCSSDCVRRKEGGASPSGCTAGVRNRVKSSLRSLSSCSFLLFTSLIASEKIVIHCANAFLEGLVIAPSVPLLPLLVSLLLALCAVGLRIGSSGRGALFISMARS